MKVIPKKWRELPIKEKLDLPVNYFGFDKKKVERVRAILDKRKRIIEAARLQFNKFGDIHSFLVAWIAGYSSDAAPRQIFGSMRDLRNLFIRSPNKIPGVEFSWKDLQRGVKIPEKMTLELAEETGIHLGDGCLYVYTDKNGAKFHQYSVSGDLRDEEIYHLNYVVPLIKRLYNLEPDLLKRVAKNSIETRIKRDNKILRTITLSYTENT